MGCWPLSLSIIESSDQFSGLPWFTIASSSVTLWAKYTAITCHYHINNKYSNMDGKDPSKKDSFPFLYFTGGSSLHFHHDSFREYALPGTRLEVEYTLPSLVEEAMIFLSRPCHPLPP